MKVRIGGAVERTGFSRKTLTAAVERGELEMIRPAGKYGHRYFETDELDRWLKSIKSKTR